MSKSNFNRPFCEQCVYRYLDNQQERPSRLIDKNGVLGRMRKGRFENVECEKSHTNRVQWEGNSKYRFESGVCAIWQLDEQSLLPYRRKYEREAEGIRVVSPVLATA